MSIPWADLPRVHEKPEGRHRVAAFATHGLEPPRIDLSPGIESMSQDRAPSTSDPVPTPRMLPDLRMLAKRIIPCLDVNEGRVVKGTNFVNLRDAGDPVAVAARYEEE